MARSALKTIGIFVIVAVVGIGGGLIVVNLMLFTSGSTPTWPFYAYDNLKEQHQQSDTKTLADRWPMKPPVKIPLSDWTDQNEQVTRYRYVDVDGKIATESYNSGGNVISFVPETATTADRPK